MCICNNEYEESRVTFEDTILVGFEVRNPDGKVEHVLGYYNKVRTRPAAPGSNDLGWNVRPSDGSGDFGWHIAPPARKPGNAMLIAVPAKKGTLDKDSLIPVGEFPQFMEDYKRAVVPPPPMSRSRAISFAAGGDDDEPVVVKGFDGGTYDVVISKSAAAIMSVLDKVDEEKRPQSNVPLWTKLDLIYPNFTFLLFCFAEQDAQQAGCALVKYEPIPGLEHLLFLPALDGHNGDIETGEVELNHTLVVGSYDMTTATGKVGNRVRFSDEALRTGTLPYYLLDRVIGKVIEPGTRAPQGDFLFSLRDVRAGKLRAQRALPPGWENVYPGSAPARCIIED